MYLGLRIIAGVLWTLALTLMVLGSFHHYHQLAASNWALFVAMIAASLTHFLWWEQNQLKEAQRNRKLLADAVAEAIARHGIILTSDGVSRPSRDDLSDPTH